MRNPISIGAAAAALLVAGAGPARAAIEDGAFGTTAAVAPAELSTVRGMADTAMMVRAENNSTVSGNSVTGQSQTGTISFDSAAFQNMSGLSLLSANTGNNVSINSSLNVNVAIRPQ